MTPRLGLLVCANFIAEVRAAVTAEGWADVEAAGFPSRCGRPPLDWTEIRALLPENCTQVVLLGVACAKRLPAAPDDLPPIQTIVHEQCFDLVAPPILVREMIAGGAYLMTPGWLKDWRAKVAGMGFDADRAGEFFHDFARQIVLLDTGLEAESQARFDELAVRLNMPSLRIAVGLDYVRRLLAGVVCEWRLADCRRQEQENARAHARERADQVAAMDLLTRLARTHQEPDVIRVTEELFRMLFAPAHWYFLMREGGRLPAPEGMAAALYELAAGLQHPYAWTPSGRGFMLQFNRGEQLLAVIVADELTFPEYRERYLNMALGIADVCALALENARTRQRLIEAEKMASLGVLVAGVAHEISTPVGIGTTAATALESQTRRLADQFAARNMKQSDLSAYLASAASEARLIAGNLERIGRLIDAFRQVAVEKKPPAKRSINFRELIQAVAASVGNGRLRERLQVRIDCADSLEVESYPGDWAGILTNLFANSLQHGFNGRDHGCIEISASVDDHRLCVDYADDGNGLSPDARQHIFDPFFTTDMQHGMGLGMHLVYNLVTQRFGGSIVCDRAATSGARFRIEVPL